MTHPRRKQPAGFTLLELLLAVAVTGALAAGLFGGLGVVFDARDAAESELENREAARAALSVLRDELACAVPPEAGALADTFEGLSASNRGGEPADTLVFFTTSLALPTGEPRGDLFRVEWKLEEAIRGPDEGTYRLVQYVTDDLEAEAIPEPTPQVLVRGVASLALRYHDGGDWVDTWDGIERDGELPRAVEVTLGLPPVESEAADRTDGTADTEPRRLVRIVPLPMSTLEARGF